MLGRRSFVQTAIGVGAAAIAAPGWALGRTRAGPPGPLRRFEVTTTIDLAATGSPAQLWLPVFAAAAPGQKRLARQVHSDAYVRNVSSSGAELLHLRWDRPGAPRRVSLVEQVAIWDRTPADPSPRLTAAEREVWLAPSGSAADQRLARDLAERIVGNRREPWARLRAIYDWVVATTWRDAAVLGCGTGDAPAMLREARYGGKCADINGLIVCLARAAGMPAREVYGIRLADSARFRSLGRSGDVTAAQHCRAEVWLADHGWFAVDPADVRKAVLEEKLAVDSPPIVALADDLFGSAEGNWAGYNSAAPIRLPGAPQAPRLRFLMYPTAMGAGGEIDSLDAAQFVYRIESREVLA